MSQLSEAQILKYATKLSTDVTDKQSKECLEKMGFMVIHDIRGLEYLIQEEIVYRMSQISRNKLLCIKQELTSFRTKMF
jgi:hypothetical protein